jgi:micrococcal nuclease
MPRLSTIILTPFAFITMFGLAYADSVTGKVIGVHDGDTITVLDAQKQQVKVRLNGIDAPEIGQAFGRNAKEELSEQVFGKTVRVVVAGTDRYGRTVGDVYVREKWVNLEMVAYGMAWHYKQYSKSPELAKAQESAKAKKLGLWADKNPVPPWEYRKEERESSK